MDELASLEALEKRGQKLNWEMPEDTGLVAEPPSPENTEIGEPVEAPESEPESEAAPVVAQPDSRDAFNKWLRTERKLTSAVFDSLSDRTKLGLWNEFAQAPTRAKAQQTAPKAAPRAPVKPKDFESWDSRKRLAWANMMGLFNDGLAKRSDFERAGLPAPSEAA